MYGNIQKVRRTAALRRRRSPESAAYRHVTKGKADGDVILLTVFVQGSVQRPLEPIELGQALQYEAEMSNVERPEAEKDGQGDTERHGTLAEAKTRGSKLYGGVDSPKAYNTGSACSLSDRVSWMSLFSTAAERRRLPCLERPSEERRLA